MGYILSKIYDNIKKYGVLKSIKRAIIKSYHILAENITNFFLKGLYNRQLDNIIKENSNKDIFILFPFFDFNMPNFQRFQQLAIAFGKRNDAIFFYCTPNNIYDNIYGFRRMSKISCSLYLTNQYNLLCSRKDIKRNIIFVSTDTKYQLVDVKRAISNGDKIIYDFVDDIHEDIVGKGCNKLIEKHNFMLQDDRIFVLATSRILYNEAFKKRKNNVFLVTNGVCVEDFIYNKYDDRKVKNQHMVENFINKFNITLCYYGALAKWFDYNLVKDIATDLNIGILLIGVDYDGSFKESELDQQENILYLGPVYYIY